MKQLRKMPEKKITAAYYCRAAPKRVWIYCRVAEGNPNTDLLDAQRERLEKYAAENGWHIEGVSFDQQAGIDLMRSGLAEVTEAVNDARVDIVLVARMDRLARRTGDLLSYCGFLEQHEVELHSMAEESVGISAGLRIAEALRDAFLKSTSSVM